MRPLCFALFTLTLSQENNQFSCHLRKGEKSSLTKRARLISIVNGDQKTKPGKSSYNQTVIGIFFNVERVQRAACIASHEDILVAKILEYKVSFMC